MRWEKKGRVFCASGEFGWMSSHAQIPTGLCLGDKIRIYFATRPEAGSSVTAFLDVDALDPGKVVYVHDRPVLEPGRPGSFDEHGVMPQYACVNDGQIWLYYAGWSRRTGVPYSNWTGLAISEDGGTTFRKAFDGPILDRTPKEIYSVTGAYILRGDDGWHLWYASGVDWIEVNGRLEEYYVIKHARSEDGVNWQRDGVPVLPGNGPPRPTHRPSILQLGDRYHMWYCHRGIADFRDGADAYRMGYATSEDLQSWKRDDARAGITVSERGWDSTMVAYPYVLQVPNRVIMLYNGNGFGASGFGYAELRVRA
jgi:hypothetical protein